MEDAPAGAFKYKAFLSYRSADREIATRVHRALENYKPPKARGGPLPRRLGRVFRDRDEARTAADIETVIANELSNSEQLIVLCTPKATEPGSWVGREVELFRKLRPGAPIHCVIGYGEPPGCFPAQVLSEESDGQVRQPLAADLRKQGDGWNKGVVRLAAGLLDVPFDALWQREQRRRSQVHRSIAASAVVLVSGFGALGLFQSTFLDSVRLATVAEANMRAGNPIAALPFAIAAQPPQSALVGARGERVASTLSELAKTPIAVDLGTVAGFEISTDGAAILAFDDAGRTTLIRTFEPEAPAVAIAGVTLRPFSLKVFAPDNRSVLLWSGTEYRAGPIARVDLVTGRADELMTAEWVFRAPQRPFMIARDESGLCKLISASGGRPVDMGACLAMSGSRDGSIVATFSPDGYAQIVSAEGAPLRRFPLGLTKSVTREYRGGPTRLAYSVQNFDLAPEGDVLAVVDGNDTFRLFDTQSGQQLASIAIQTPFAGGYMIASSRAAVLLTDNRGMRRFVDLSKRGLTTEIGIASGSGFDPSMNFLNVSAGQAARLFDLRHGVREMTSPRGFQQVSSTGDDTISDEGDFGLALRSTHNNGERVPLGTEIETRFSEDASTLVTVDKRMRARVYRIRPRFPMRDVGIIGQRDTFSISATGAVLGVRNIDGSVLVYDLRNDVRRPTTANVCATSGHAIRPFPSAMRAPDPAALQSMSPEDRALSEALKGRPWHPCDWRGLGAIEGWAQALRALLVRIGVRPDYSCRDRSAFGRKASNREDWIAERRCARSEQALKTVQVE